MAGRHGAGTGVAAHVRSSRRPGGPWVVECRAGRAGCRSTLALGGRGRCLGAAWARPFRNFQYAALPAAGAVRHRQSGLAGLGSPAPLAFRCGFGRPRCDGGFLRRAGGGGRGHLAALGQRASRQTAVAWRRLAGSGCFRNCGAGVAGARGAGGTDHLDADPPRLARGATPRHRAHCRASDHRTGAAFGHSRRGGRASARGCRNGSAAVQLEPRHGGGIRACGRCAGKALPRPGPAGRDSGFASAGKRARGRRH